MSDTDDCPDYAMIKSMALTLKRPAHSLIALSDDRDPFYITPARHAGAVWFAEIWAVLDPPDGVHLRRLHYRLVVADPPLLNRNGVPYSNTEGDWGDLSEASADARALELVDADKFTDRRAGEPVFVANDSGQGYAASIRTYGAWQGSHPFESAFSFRYEPKRFEFPDDLPDAAVSPPHLAEPYALEIWAEKSTMNDILMPLAQRLNITLVTGLGELSFTHCVWQIRRVLAHGKKTRILYISDHDPSGDRMPVSIARKIEYLLRRDGYDFDVRLEPIVLTIEQVQRYRLPRKPIKDSDAGKKHFEGRFGEGAVELDALEALHPGEFARIVESAIDFYRAPTREARRENNAVAREAWDATHEARDAVLAEHESEIEALREAFEQMQAAIEVDQTALAAIAEDVAARSQAHVDAINDRVSAFYAEAGDLWARIGAAVSDRLPDADAFAWVEEAGPADDETEALFDSHRTYLDQIEIYKKHTGRPTARRAYGSASAGKGSRKP